MEYNDIQDNTATKFSRLTTITQKNSIGESLKPISLNWAYLPPSYEKISYPNLSFASEPFVEYQSRQFASIDVNGDGILDLVQVSPVQIITGPDSWSNDTKVYIYYGSKELDPNGNIKFETNYYQTGYSIGPNILFSDWQSIIQGANSLDFDGDGVDDLVIPIFNRVDESGTKYVEFRFVGGKLNNRTLESPNQSGVEMPLYAFCDFNNNGKGNVLVIDRTESEGKYPGRIFELDTNNYDKPINLTLSFSLPSKPELVFTSDFNRNGMQDIMVVHNDGYTIYWNQGNALNTSTFSDDHKTSGTNVKTNFGTEKDGQMIYRTMMRPGDFNGDGLVDFVISNTDQTNWYFAFNNGNGTFTKSLAATLDLFDQAGTEHDDGRFDCSVYDFDGDGKSDVVITKAMYNIYSDPKSIYGRYKDTHTRWLRSTGSVLEEVAKVTSTREDDALSGYYVLGDFDGSGKTQLMNFGYNCYDGQNGELNPTWRIYTPNIQINSGKIDSFRDGYENITYVSYTSLMNDTIYSLVGDSKYPYIENKQPLHVVEKVYNLNLETMNNSSISYKYKGLKSHVQGRGLLGFDQIATVDNRGRQNTQTFDPLNFSILKNMDGTDASAVYNYDINVAANKIATINLNNKTEIDKINKVSVTTTYSDYDNYGNPGTVKADYGSGITSTTTTEYNNLTGSPYILGQVKSQTTVNTRSSKSATTRTTFGYNSVGLPISKVSFYEANQVSADSMKYNDLHQLTESKTRPYNSKDWTRTSYAYDGYGRIQTKTDALGLTETYGYNSLGQLETVKNHKGLVTTYGYDSWGRQNKVTYPDGTESIISYTWDETLNNSYIENPEDPNKPFPEEVSPDPYPSGKGKNKQVYITIPAWNWSLLSGGLNNWDYDKNVAQAYGYDLTTKTYKTVDIDEYEWTTENLKLKYNSNYEWMNLTQANVDAYAATYLSNKSIPLKEFEDIFGTWLTQYDQGIAYRNNMKVYDKKDGTQIKDWKLPSVGAFEQLFGQAPRATGNVYEDIKDFLFASACDMRYDWQQDMFNRKNISGLTLTPLGMRGNVQNGDKYGFGQLVGLQSDQQSLIMIISNMTLSGLKPGIYGNWNYHFTQGRYCREKTAQELGYKLYIDSINNKVVMLPDNQVSTLPELPKGLERGIALRYANRQYMYILKSWKAIQAEATEIRSKMRINSDYTGGPFQPCPVEADPFEKGKTGSIYVKTPNTWESGGLIFESYDLDKNIQLPGEWDGTVKTYKTIEIGEMQYTAENIMVKYRKKWGYTDTEYINLTQPIINSMNQSFEGKDNIALDQFSKINGSYLTSEPDARGYYTSKVMYDKAGGTVLSGWDLTAKNDLYYLFGLAPKRGGSAKEDIFHFLFASKNDVPAGYNAPWFNYSNTSGLGLTPLGRRHPGSTGLSLGNGNYQTFFAYKTECALKVKDLPGGASAPTSMVIFNIGSGISYQNLYHYGQGRYCRMKTAEELGYDLYIDSGNDKVLMLPVNSPTTLKKLEVGIERGVAVRYANKAKMRVTKSWTEIQKEAADILKQLSLN